MPKSDQLVLRVGGEYVADVYAIEWPASVERVDGQWLWIADNSGYRVPAVAGWVSKDDVLNVDEAHDYYMEILQTADAPWLHWFVGICLETSRETETAQDEYARCLNVSPCDGNAVQAAVDRNANLLDAAVRLQRLQAAEVKSAAEAAAAADMLKSLSETAARDGIRRPYVYFEQAEALRKAFRLKVAEERKGIHGIDAQIARASSERDGGADEAGELFERPTTPTSACGGESWMRLCRPALLEKLHGQGRAVPEPNCRFEDEAWSLIAAGAMRRSHRRQKPPGQEGPPINSTPRRALLDLTMLDAFLSQWQSSPQKPAAAKQAEAVCVCLAEEIRLLHVAVACFDAAVSRSSNHIEAYRDRGLAYLALARCEATLAAIEEADQDVQTRLAGLYPDQELSPRRLDRALVDGRKHFNEVLDKLPAAQAKQAEIAAEKKDLPRPWSKLLRVTSPPRPSVAAVPTKEPNMAKAASSPRSALTAIQQKLAQLRADGAKAAGQLDQERRRPRKSFSKPALRSMRATRF